MGVFNQFLLYKQIDVPLSTEYLENNLSGEPRHGFTIVETDDHQYKCLSNFSLGTFSRTSFFGPSNYGIKIYMSFDPYLASRTNITLKTRLRPELIVFAAAIFLLTIVIITQPTPDFNKNYLFLFPLLVLWSWFVFRIQEYLLLRRVEKYLNELVDNKAV
ncbi:MAG: hypothetical protein JST32_06260 [Bacteroidetes bacterium]|nr:hypothetical protein [Bacteroidota bacterium]